MYSIIASVEERLFSFDTVESFHNFLLEQGIFFQFSPSETEISYRVPSLEEVRAAFTKVPFGDHIILYDTRHFEIRKTGNCKMVDSRPRIEYAEHKLGYR